MVFGDILATFSALGLSPWSRGDDHVLDSLRPERFLLGAVWASSQCSLARNFAAQI